VTIDKDGITDHIRAQEDEYFRRKDRELVEMLRKADADAKARRALERETGLHDPAKAGVSNAERTLILNLARARGIAEGSPADHQLKVWMDVKPSDDTFHKAARLIGAIVDSPDHRVPVNADTLLEYCDRIAHASGGIFGIGVVSPEERAAIEEIAASFKDRRG
jgi:hypothetical protein